MDKKLIHQGIEALSLIDQDIAQAVKQYGLPDGRTYPQGFEAFLFTIISQQLSTKVAITITDRVLALMPACTPEQFIQISTQSLRDAGLSHRKIEYIQGIATAAVEGNFDIDGLQHLDDERAIKTIINMRGLGRWSAEIYLMFALDRHDIFPADDLGILLGLQKLKGLASKPTPKEAREMVTHWAPWRSVGSLFLWHYYHQN